MKTIQCAHPFSTTMALWQHDGYRLSTVRELCHWLSIAGMLPQNHCGDEEDGRIALYRYYKSINMLK